ncbi:MAG: hypothetical protein IPH48_02560 [bacterium]|nr:hypothetical protein [bacterium]
MKTFIKIALVLTLGLSASSVMAFHDAGVAYCAGCHTMHNSQNGALVDTAHPNGNAYLLNAGNPSDTCLRCHAGYGQFKNGEGFGPGGDYYWVTRTFSWVSRGATLSSTGDSHGHNVISPARGIAQDATLANAPGGSFLSSRLACTSCHDPHGNQNFRLLYGAGAGPKYDGTRYAFTNAAPLALGNSRNTYGTQPGVETNTDHTIYKSGMSMWCANCHTTLHDNNTANFVHPTRSMGSTVAATYNAYVSSDDISSGNAATSYWGLVPFEAASGRPGDRRPRELHAGPDGHRRSHVPDLPPRARLAVQRHRALGHERQPDLPVAPAHDRRRLHPDGRRPEVLQLHLRGQPALAVQQVPRQGRVRPRRRDPLSHATPDCDSRGPRASDRAGPFFRAAAGFRAGGMV